MSKNTFQTKYLKDYKKPDFVIEHVELAIDLHEEETLVTSTMKLKRANASDCALELDGDGLQLKSLKQNGVAIDNNAYQLTDEKLVISKLPNEFVLEIVTRIEPQKNTALSGLYKSKNMFCTQCEANGFRRITYFLDRPDVLTRYTTKLIADKKRYPVLLSNGNAVARGDLDNGRHFVTWDDPFKKPSYLFAAVAGDLASIRDQFITMSGKKVDLWIYVEKGNEDKCSFAMDSLKRSMKWDEETYGREYDLEIFNIVAVSDFNMGAMENKSLNIFNAKYILANPQTATDSDYEHIENVVAHEYFHNWTGDRVTCRDWFQLSLKEGLTVFRDQEFSADMHSRDVKRIGDVEILRSTQFAEDAGPMAHPVRPESYIEINNFYTVTVYNKGSEVIRMQRTLLGKEGFRKGMDLYFERHDGQAVTTDDFVKAMEDANDVDFSQFKLWYQQAGTPRVIVKKHYDAAAKKLTLYFSQSCPSTPGQSEKKPFHIPLALGLLDAAGNDIPFVYNETQNTTHVIELKNAHDEVEIDHVECDPTLSLLRNFSAPIKIEYEQSNAELIFLLAHDSNGFARWEAGQKLAVNVIVKLMEQHAQNDSMQFDGAIIESYRQVLLADSIDPALQARLLTLPSFDYLADQVRVVDVDALYSAREFFKSTLAKNLRSEFMQQYKANVIKGPYHNDSVSIAMRSLKNVCLAYLTHELDDETKKICLTQLKNADNMTDELSALACISHHECDEREQALTNFYEKWKGDELVLDKWFSIHARSDVPDALSRVKKLLHHRDFQMKNPNKVRALIASFCFGNPIHFHDVSGLGYEFLRERVVELDKMNPQIAARLSTPLSNWRRYDERRRDLMRAQLQLIVDQQHISKDVHEIVSKSLAQRGDE